MSRRPADGTGSYGIYRFEIGSGSAGKVYDDPKWHDIEARALVPRPVPDGRSSVVNERDPTGILYCLNVSTSDLPNPKWMPPGSAKRLRVLEGLPRPGAADSAGFEPPAKRVLGEINVARDGSFNIRVPANIPIQLQLLDDRGMALRSCSWIWVQNKEPRGCIGCHEDGELVPENRMVDAVLRPSIALTLPPERRREVSFEKDVKPIFREKCSNESCHGGMLPVRLTERDQVRMHLGRVARTSPLVWHLYGRNTSRPWDGVQPTDGAVIELMPPREATPLSDDEKRAILEWIDMGAE